MRRGATLRYVMLCMHVRMCALARVCVCVCVRVYVRVCMKC